MVIRSFSELTWVLMVHAPRAYEAQWNGKLVKSECWVGSSPFFYFSPNHVEVNSGVTYLDSAHVYEPDWKVPGIPPPYKTHYTNTRFRFDKPIVIVNNKYIEEWKRDPINFISIDDLRAIFTLLCDAYTVVYIRAKTNERGYWDDNQPSHEFGDYDMIANEFPQVVCMNQLLMDNPDLSYNKLQLMLHANSNKFISIAGGNAVISSYFGGEHIIYRSPVAKSDGRLLWHSNSNLTLLSGAQIIGTNNSSELHKLVQLWT